MYFHIPYPDHDVVIIDATAMITIFCTVVLSVIQGIALNTDVLPLVKGRALQTDSLLHRSCSWVYIDVVLSQFFRHTYEVSS